MDGLQTRTASTCQMLYKAARERHPLRWKGATRNWQRIHVVHLNPDHAEQNSAIAQPRHQERKAA
jgi:putative transposase